MRDNDQSGGGRRWALRLVAMAAVVGLASTVSATSAFADMNGPWDQPASFARAGVPVYPESPDNWWACAWANDCRPTAAREPGDPAPIWFSQGRDKITVVCELGARYRIEKGDLDGWAPASEIYTEYTTQAGCAVWD